MQNFSDLRGPGEEEVPADTGDYGALIGTYFSYHNGKQPKGLSCQEAYNLAKFAPGIPDDTSEIDSSPPSTTRSQTIQSSNVMNPNSSKNFNPMEEEEEDDELIDNFGSVAEPTLRNDYVEGHGMEEEKDQSNFATNIDNFYGVVIEIESLQISNDNNRDEMTQEKREIQFSFRMSSENHPNHNEEEEQIESTSENMPKSKQSTKMKTMPALFMVEVKRAYQYYLTRHISKKKFELESIGKVIRSGRYSNQTLGEFDRWIKKYKPKTKSYEELIAFLARNYDPGMERLLKRFATCIFKNEKKVWLEKSGTKKKKQFEEVLDKFAFTFLYVLEFKSLPY